MVPVAAGAVLPELPESEPESLEGLPVEEEPELDEPRFPEEDPEPVLSPEAGALVEPEEPESPDDGVSWA